MVSKLLKNKMFDLNPDPESGSSLCTHPRSQE